MVVGLVTFSNDIFYDLICIFKATLDIVWSVDSCEEILCNDASSDK